jgi:hypothetical protein
MPHSGAGAASENHGLKSTETVKTGASAGPPKQGMERAGWFLLSGSIGSALFFLLHEALWKVVWWQAYKGAFCW